MLELKDLKKRRTWEVAHSSLAKISKDATYEQCRKYACEDIIRNLTKLPRDMPKVMEIPEGTEFHFIGRVDTNLPINNVSLYYKSFETRDFISFSVINNKNISRYYGLEAFYIYDLLPSDIAHIFPTDSDTKTEATTEEDLTTLPSLWLTLKELEDASSYLEVCNQITAKTKRNGTIIKPIAVTGFDGANIAPIAEEFGISSLILHPNANAINYKKDFLYVGSKFNSVSSGMKDLFGVSLDEHIRF